MRGIQEVLQLLVRCQWHESHMKNTKRMPKNNFQLCLGKTGQNRSLTNHWNFYQFKCDIKTINFEFLEKFLIFLYIIITRYISSGNSFKNWSFLSILLIYLINTFFAVSIDLYIHTYIHTSTYLLISLKPE